MSEKSFFIYFNFPLENSGKFICMEAIVEPDRSSLYYNVHSFRNFNGVKKETGSITTVLPDIKIKQQNTTANNWVHIDSDQASVLSNIIGKAIENRSSVVAA